MLYLSIEGPGAVTERMAICTPSFLFASSSRAGVHGGIYQPDGSPPAFSRAKGALEVNLGTRFSRVLWRTLVI